MEIYGNLRKSMESIGSIENKLESIENLLESTEIYGNPWNPFDQLKIN